MINKEGWEKKKLGEMCEVFNGGTPDTTKKEFWDGSILWITPKDMGRMKSIYVDDTERKITEAGLKNSSARILPINSIVISSRAPIGHLAINTRPICTNQGCKGLVPKDELITQYLYYFLKDSVQLLNDLGTGATFKEISGTKLGNVKIPIPPLPIQQQIVSELDALSDIIIKKKQQLEELHKLAQATFYNIFGDPVSNEKGWEKCCINSVCKFTQGIQIGVEQQFTEKDDNCNRFLRISDYTQDCEFRYVRENNSKYIVKEDDVVIVRYGASAGFVGINKTGVLANNLFKLNHDREALNNLFLYSQLQSEHYKSFILKVAFGAAMPALSFTVFKDFEIIIPPLTLQNQFSQRKITYQKVY